VTFKIWDKWDLSNCNTNRKFKENDESGEWNLTATPLMLNLKPLEPALWSKRTLANW